MLGHVDGEAAYRQEVVGFGRDLSIGIAREGLGWVMGR
jgi:hypothetical protein